MDRGRVRVFSSVLAGYTFFFRHFGRLLHVAWFPGVLFVIAGMFANELIRQVNVGAMANGEIESALWYLLVVMLAYSLFQLAMTLVVVVGFYRVGLYDFKPRGVLYFRFLNEELRTAGAWFLVVVALYTLFMAMVYLAILVVGALVGFLGMMGPVGGIVEFASENTGSIFKYSSILGMSVMIWAYSRFFLAMPAALDHKASTLGEIWSATKGNNIRLLLYLLILVASLLVFFFSIAILIFIAIFVAAGVLVPILSPEAISAVGALSQNIEQLVLGLPNWQRYAVMGISQIIGFFAYIFFWAIVIGSASAAFRDIFPSDAEQT